jgi:hypothetical protein
MIVWSGWGIMVPVFNVLAFFLGAILIGQAHLDTKITEAAGLALWGVLAGVAIYFSARAIESKKGRVLIDEATQRRIVFKPSAGSFFFIPTRYWAFINPAAGVLLAGLTYESIWNPLAR